MSEAMTKPVAKDLRRFKPYPAYKDSGVEWLREIPAHWKCNRLRYVTQLNPIKSEVRGLDPQLPVSFVPMESVGEYGGLTLDAVKPLAASLEGYTYFRDGDVIVAKITPCFENGKGALAAGLENGIGFGTTELHVLRATAGTDARFVFYLTLGDHFRRLGAATMYGAGGQKRVPEDFIRNLRHPLPSKPEQRAIAAFLDRETARIDALVAKKERHVELLQEKTNALIERVVSGARSFREVRLGYYVDLLAGYAFESSGFSHDSEDVRLLRGANVSTGNIRWDDIVYWPSSDLGKFQRYQLQKGDLVFGMDRPWIGSGIRVAEISDADIPSLLLQRVARLRAKPGLSQSYLRVLLSSPQFRAYFEPILTGISVPHVSPDQILSFRVRLPPVHVQESKVFELRKATSAANAMRKMLEQSIESLKELRTALISAAVTGKIDVREQVG